MLKYINMFLNFNFILINQFYYFLLHTPTTHKNSK
jgi:hypothetical protein